MRLEVRWASGHPASVTLLTDDIAPRAAGRHWDLFESQRFRSTPVPAFTQVNSFTLGRFFRQWTLCVRYCDRYNSPQHFRHASPSRSAGRYNTSTRRSHAGHIRHHRMPCEGNFVRSNPMKYESGLPDRPAGKWVTITSCSHNCRRRLHIAPLVLSVVATHRLAGHISDERFCFHQGR